MLRSRATLRSDISISREVRGRADRPPIGRRRWSRARSCREECTSGIIPYMPDDRCNRRLLLITASSHHMRAIRRSRVIHFQQCTMPYLAALTPSGWEVEHVDEEVEEVDFTGHYDLVG